MDLFDKKMLYLKQSFSMKFHFKRDSYGEGIS